MNIDMKSTIDELKAIQNRFNDPENVGTENSYLCLCSVEDLAKELLEFVADHKPLYRKLVIEQFRSEIKEQAPKV